MFAKAGFDQIQLKGSSMKKMIIAMLFLFPLASLAQTETSNGGEATSAPKVAFTYRLSQTTRAEMDANWADSGALKLGQGHLALGGGSGVDNVSQAFAPNVDLIDVSGADFEGISVARFGFYDGILYKVQARLLTQVQTKANIYTNQTRVTYSEDDVNNLAKRLVSKYGKASKSSGAPGKVPDTLIWNVGDNQLIFSRFTNGGASLVLDNQKMDAKVKQYVKVVCKSYNTKDKIVCW
jgi:hypothetical protein